MNSTTMSLSLRQPPRFAVSLVLPLSVLRYLLPIKLVCLTFTNRFRRFRTLSCRQLWKRTNHYCYLTRRELSCSSSLSFIPIPLSLSLSILTLWMELGTVRLFFHIMCFTFLIFQLKFILIPIVLTITNLEWGMKFTNYEKYKDYNYLI